MLSFILVLIYCMSSYQSCFVPDQKRPPPKQQKKEKQPAEGLCCTQDATCTPTEACTKKQRTCKLVIIEFGNDIERALFKYCGCETEKAAKKESCKKKKKDENKDDDEKSEQEKNQEDFDVDDVLNCRYFYVDTEMTFNDAELYCNDAFGTHLATINSEEAIQYALDVVGDSKEPWIGLYNTHNIGWFYFIDPNAQCADTYSGACIHFWADEHPRCIIDEQGRCEYEDDYSGDGYSYTVFYGSGKVDNIEPGDSLRPFLCNAPVKAALEFAGLA